MTVTRGAPAFWFVELFLDEVTLRYTNAFLPITFDGETYTALGDRMRPPPDIDRTASLKSQKFSIEFDSSRQTDNSDEIGVILDSSWKRRPMRARYAVGAMGAAGYDFSAPEIIADEAGRILDLVDNLSAGDVPTLEMEVESGALIFLERRNQTRSPANQKAAFPGDLFFDLARQLDGVVLPWRTKKAKMGSTQIRYEVEGVAPREMIIGRAKTRGSFVFGATTNNHRVLWSQIYALADHQCEALEEIWINGTPVLNGTVLTHGTRTPLTAFRSSESGAAGTRLYVTWYDGRHDQTADALLISETASQPLKWTANHRGRGVSYVKIEHIWDSDNPEAFSYEFLVRGAKIYQERKDSTAGGSGSHRLDDPSTWEWSTNPEEALRHYLRGRVTAPGSSHMWFGVGAPSTFLDPYSVYAARAAHCDGTVATISGTQKRYEANGRLSAANDHATSIRLLADCMVARAVDEGGRISIRLSEPQTPVIELTDADLIEGEDSELGANARSDDVVNRIEGRFTDPANKYDPVDYPAVESEVFAAIDGESITETWNQEFETNVERAQRKATLFLNQRRRTVELTEHFGARAWIVRPGDWLTRKSDLRGFPGGKLFIAEEVRRFVDGTVRLVLLEVDPSELVWSEESAQLPDDTEVFEFEPVVIVALPVTVTPVSISNTETIIPGVQVTRDDDDDLSFSIIAEIALDNGSGGPAGYRRSYTLPAKGLRSETIGGLLPSTAYVIRTRYTDGTYYTAWTPWQSFTTTDEFQATTALDAAPESALAEALATAESARKQLSELILSLQVRLDDTRENLGKLGKIDGVPVGTAIRNVQQEIVENGAALTQVIDVVAARVDDAESAIVAEQLARAAADEAEAIARQLVEARLQNAEGSITSERQARIAADDALAQNFISVDARLSGVESGQTGQAQALSGLTSRVRANERELVSQSSSITSLNNRIASAENNLTGQSTAVAALTSRVRTAENSVSTLSNSVTQLGGQVQGLSNQYSGVADALNLIQAAIVSAGGSISVDLSEITSLSSQVAGLAGQLSGQSAAINSLTSRVAANEGQINSVAQQFTNLSAGVGDLQAQVDIIAAATGTNTGAVNAFFGIRGVAGTSEFEIAGLAGGGAPSKIRLRADQIELSGQVLINGTLTTGKMAENAVSERKLYSGANTSLPSNATFADILAGTIPTAGGTVEVEFECDFACPSTVGLRIEFVVGGTVVRTVNFYCVGPFTHTVQAFARFSGFANNSTLTIRAKAQQSEGVGRAGCSVSAVTARSIELKR